MLLIDKYSGLKRKELSSHEKTWRTFKWILLNERSQSKKAKLCMIPTIWHSGWIGRAHLGQRNDSVQYYNGDTCPYKFIQTHRMYMTKNDHQCKPWVWIMMYQCRFISCSKCTTVVWDVDSAGGYLCVVGSEYMGILCILPSILLWT